VEEYTQYDKILVNIKKVEIGLYTYLGVASTLDKTE
jgi:hypothetical protein